MTTRIIEASPFLSVGTIYYNSAELDWTDISVPAYARVTSYRLYRGSGANPSSFALVWAGTGLSVIDGGLGLIQTYTYYVIGVYESGAQTPPSNRVTLTTVPLIPYMYSLNAGGLDIYDTHDPTSMSILATVGPADGGTCHENFADPDFLYCQNGNGGGATGRILRWSQNPTAPSLVVTFPSFSDFLLVRRGLAFRNNLLFRFIGPGGNCHFESYNITDPANPVLINSIVGVNGVQSGDPKIGPNSPAFDVAGSRLVYVLWSNGNYAKVAYSTVAADGTISANIDLAGGQFNTGGGAFSGNGFIRGSYYWFLLFGVTYRAVKLDGSGPDPTSYDLPGNPFDFNANGVTPRLLGNYLFLGASTGNAAHQAILIKDIRTWTTVANLGGVGNSCGGMALAGNQLFFAVGTTLYCYDVTDPTNPVLLGSLVGMAHTPSGGILGYLSSGWDGNNGLCAT